MFCLEFLEKNAWGSQTQDLVGAKVAQKNELYF
jgi:hypothetical protein